MDRQRHIAVAIEKVSEYGRRFIQGVVDFADGNPSWQLELLDPGQISTEALRFFDGWICRITDAKILRRLSRTGVPVVDALCLQPTAGFSTVRTDYAAIGRLAAEHFRSRRFTRFAFCGYRHVTFSDLRRNAYARHLEKRGIRPRIYRPPYAPGNATVSDRQLRDGTDSSVIGDAAALQTWLTRLPKPIGVFCCDDFRAKAVARLCAKAKIRVPEEVAILGVDDDPLYCMFGSPRLSSIDPDAHAIGFAAGEALEQMLDGNGKPLARVIPPKGIIQRASTDTYPDAPRWFPDALGFIRREIGAGISAADVFRHTGYSRTLVEKAFRRLLGKTVQQEISSVRLEEAKRLLQTTNLPMREISARAGYASVEYFTRTFSAAVGTSPAAFHHHTR